MLSWWLTFETERYSRHPETLALLGRFSHGQAPREHEFPTAAHNFDPVQRDETVFGAVLMGTKRRIAKHPISVPNVFAMMSETVGYRLGSIVCTSSIDALAAKPSRMIHHAYVRGHATASSRPSGTNRAMFARNSKIV